jgi:hypothetical protein
MDNNNTAIINVGNTCCNCLKETTVHNIRIPSMGWGSGFDNWSTQIDLCDDCYKLTDPKWWELKRVKGETDWDGTYYEFESEIFKFVKQMPLAGQELFYNRYGYGACADVDMKPQDWIDFELDILPHAKCKKYHLYSPQEKKAYAERFPICQHPVNRVYKDNSSGCWCPFGAHGDYGQKCGINISSDCYQCKQFSKRTTPIRDLKDNDYEEYKIYYIAKINQDKYKDKFENT